MWRQAPSPVGAGTARLFLMLFPKEALIKFIPVIPSEAELPLFRQFCGVESLP
jgi:hypothetical protein